MPRALLFRLVYHEGYDLNLGQHVFPSRKYRLVRERLLTEGFAQPEDFVEPEMAPLEDLLLVHEADWVIKLKNGTLTYGDILRLEIPYSRRMVNGFFLAAGGTTLAARLALRDRIAFNVGGGFHHAFPDHGEGFCAINDIAVAIRRLQREGAIERALVVDCDVHQGNGTAAVFAGDRSVFTLSIHQLNNYPQVKPPSNIDINLHDDVGDEEYLNRLRDSYVAAVMGFQPHLIVYVAGADPYCEDQLGGLSLTVEGLQERDRLVLETALRHRAAAVVVLAGGYAMNVHDTVTIHSNTAKAVKEVLDDAGWHRPY
jgi:acetoin utilization deacetylase AcuC-like enzyme